MYTFLKEDYEALKRIKEVYQGTWDDMCKEEGWDNKERLKVLNYLVVLEELVNEYKDLYETSE